MKTPTKPTKLTELRRRRCDNCNRLYRPAKEHQRFCTDRIPGTPDYCRREFHHNSSAYGPLKIKLEKLVLKTIREESHKLRALIQALEERIDGIESLIRVLPVTPPPAS